MVHDHDSNDSFDFHHQKHDKPLCSTHEYHRRALQKHSAFRYNSTVISVCIIVWIWPYCNLIHDIFGTIPALICTEDKPPVICHYREPDFSTILLMIFYGSKYVPKTTFSLVVNNKPRTLHILHCKGTARPVLGCHLQIQMPLLSSSLELHNLFAGSYSPRSCKNMMLLVWCDIQEHSYTTQHPCASHRSFPYQ